MTGASWGGRRAGAGMKRCCNCNRWGCLKCMRRFLWEHYKRRAVTAPDPPIKRYEWDRT